jgi:S1-C subfamily serine protease
MTAVDWIIVAFTLAFAGFGYLRGFIVGALSLAGFVLGAVLGARIGPSLLSAHSHSPYAPLFALGGALIVGGLLAALLEGFGTRLRGTLRLPGLGLLDGILGALLTACVGLGIVWVAGAVAVQAPGTRSIRRDLQRSVVLRALNGVLPPSGPILNALSRFDPLPTIAGPGAGVAAPDPKIARSAGVRRARPSVVRVLGTACGLGVEGSGWVAAPGLVVTNAHVVAGENDTTVQPAGAGDRLSARAVAFDPRNDLAVLRVTGLPSAPLRIDSDPPAGTSAAVLGFPLDGPFDVEPGRIGTSREIISQDAYGRGPVKRDVLPLRARVRSGNSGGPMVDGRGAVVGTVFAATARRGSRSGLAVPNSVALRVLKVGARGRQVSTGSCGG